MADTDKPAATVAEATSPITAALADQIALQQKEYGQYVAAVQIWHGSGLAYNPGDAIPAENCERLGYVKDNLAVKVGTKAHEELLKSLGR